MSRLERTAQACLVLTCGVAIFIMAAGYSRGGVAGFAIPGQAVDRGEIGRARREVGPSKSKCSFRNSIKLPGLRGQHATIPAGRIRAAESGSRRSYHSRLA
jgi:hypothetical protein